MALPFRRLFEPLTIANFTVRNRVVSTPHSPRLPGSRDLRYFEERARGGVGLFGFATGYGVHAYGVGVGAEGQPGQWDARPPSPLTPKGIALYDSLEIPALREHAKVVHAHGARCFGQMAHAGAANAFISINPLLGPSNVGTPIDALSPYALSEEQVEELIFCFAHAIRRVAEAGLDAAEIHGAHGYLVHQFLSPYYNQRDDKWGGSLEKRARLPLAIIEAARKLVGNDFPIGIRLGYEGEGAGPGMTIDDLVATAKILAPQICHISVSGGNSTGIFKGFNTSYFSPWYREPAYNAKAAKAVRDAVKAPIIVAGRIADPALAEGLLADGTADLIGMVRGLIADPHLLDKAKQGDAGKQRMCLGLSECRHEGRYKTHITCAVNAAAGREDELVIVPARQRKTVVVVGAGPAGLEAARIAARRGHKVYLCDQATQIGGTVRVLAVDPNRRNLLHHSAFFESEFAELDVELLLGHPVSAENIVNFEADTVVLATGGRPLVPDIPGSHRDNVVLALDILRGAARVGKRALIVAGANNHMAAPSIAEFLSDKGHHVQLVSEQLDFASGVEDVTRFALQQRLHRKRIFPQLATRLLEVDSGALLCDVLSGEQRRVEDVTIVLACGLLPNDALYRSLKDKVPDLHLIGDALAPRRIMHATIEGARVATAI